MKTWIRAKLPTTCGQCGGIVETGESLCVLQLVGVKRKLYRCAQFKCCDSFVPPDLPAVEAPSQPRTKRMQQLAGAVPRRLAFDAKQRQVGERE